MTLDLFAGLPVHDYATAAAWYELLLGGPPTFLAHESEGVWELAQHRYVYVVQDAGRAGHGLVTFFVDDLQDRVDAARVRGVEPDRGETYGDGVHKVVFRDPDGNEIGLAGHRST